MRNKHEVCKDVSEKVGADFDWINSGNTACHITQCNPPLEFDHYDVPAHGTVPARVTGQPGTYEYKCKCDRLEANPKIIIST
jgi:hypothetical protein